MRQLRTCDFCGDDPTGVYEVLPASLAPTEAEQRRVALCVDCADTLESVLEPLLARLDGAEPAPDSSASASGTRSGRDSIADSAADPEPIDRSKRTPGPAADAEPVAEPDAPAGSDEPDADLDTDGSDDESTPSEREAARREVRRTAPRGDRPPGYDKVLRLLQNREGAMKRDDLRTLVTNAYGLGDDEFEAVVDAAVENGDLAESRKGLRTT